MAGSDASARFTGGDFLMADSAPQTTYVPKKTIAGSKAHKSKKKRKKTVAEDFPQEAALTGAASGMTG